MSVILIGVINMKYERIKSLRVDADKTQQELADYLNLTRSSYSNYENGIRDIPIEILSGTSIDYLVGRTDQRAAYPKKKDLRPPACPS